MRWALLVIAAAACSTDKGVAVFVHPSSNDVAYVRLYLGAGDSTTATLTNDTYTARRADYWTREPGNAVDLIEIAAGDDAKFAFITDETLPIVIAVGYDQQKNPIEAAIATDLARKDGDDVSAYTLDLAPAKALGTKDSMQVGLWSPPTPAVALIDAACVGAIDPSIDHPKFIVSADDQDCDGNPDSDPTRECTPDQYLGTGVSLDTDKACLTPQATAASANAPGTCTIGGAPCVDHGAPMQPTETCHPSNICVPTSLCGTCPGDGNCVRDPSAILDSTIAHYQCPVSADPTSGKACKVDFSLQRPPTGGYTCDQVAIGDSGAPASAELDKNNLKLKIGLDADKSCAATIHVDSDQASAMSA
ncbi:MAG TPA: hypothetical protein VGC41_02305, partial [Kofleriaceae bacterium]